MNKSSKFSRINRRRFLGLAGAAAAAPMIVPSRVLGLGNWPSPNSRISIGVVGWGMMGPGNTENFMRERDCRVVAACDLDKEHLKKAVDKINGTYKNKDCKSYHDYREMMARPDIDAVMLAVPDHWHALTATEACRQGKDVYGEKPLARTIVEQRAIVNAVHKHHRIWQTGSWQRSTANFHHGAELVRSGFIGKVKRVEVGLPSGHVDFMKTKDHMTATEPPARLDYDMWVGPSEMVPYIEGRIHMNWRWNYNTGGGQLLDWVGHHLDIAHWGLGFDKIGPMTIDGTGIFPPRNDVWNTATKYRIEMDYPHDVHITIAGGHDDIKSGTKWIGTDGWVWVDRSDKFECSNAEWQKTKQLPDSLSHVHLYNSTNHHRNFLDCVKSRKTTITPVDVAHHSAIPGHLGLISMLVGRKISWDWQSEKIIDDAEASKLLTRDYRAPWKLV
jgi:predicted dehydrogenase